jgi:hypothetical protein
MHEPKAKKEEKREAKAAAKAAKQASRLQELRQLPETAAGCFSEHLSLAAVKAPRPICRSLSRVCGSLSTAAASVSFARLLNCNMCMYIHMYISL